MICVAIDGIVVLADAELSGRCCCAKEDPLLVVVACVAAIVTVIPDDVASRVRRNLLISTSLVVWLAAPLVLVSKTSVLDPIVGCDTADGDAQPGDVDGCQTVIEDDGSDNDGQDFFEDAGDGKSHYRGTLNQAVVRAGAKMSVGVQMHHDCRPVHSRVLAQAHAEG